MIYFSIHVGKAGFSIGYNHFKTEHLYQPQMTLLNSYQHEMTAKTENKTNKQTKKHFQFLSGLFIQSFQYSWHKQASCEIHVDKKTCPAFFSHLLEAQKILFSILLNFISDSFEVDSDPARCSLWELSRI